MKDGRIVVVDGGCRGARGLRVFDSNGSAAAETRLDLPASAQASQLGPEVAPGRLAVSAGTLSTGGETHVVDLATLEVVERLPGLRPAASVMGNVSSPVRPGGSVHFFLGRGQLVRIDFSTGERKVVAGPGAPRGRAPQRALSDWIITSRARPEASTSRRTRGSVSRRNAASSAARRRGGVAGHQDRRAQASAHHEVRGGEAGDAAVAVVEGERSRRSARGRPPPPARASGRGSLLPPATPRGWRDGSGRTPPARGARRLSPALRGGSPPAPRAPRARPGSPRG